jgi:hypothetical protein
MTISRREFLDFLKLACAAAFLPTRLRSAALARSPTALDDGASLVNDIHSQLNPTRVSRVVRPTLMPGTLYCLRLFLAAYLVLLTMLFGSSCSGVSVGAVRKSIQKNLPLGSTAGQVIAYLDAKRIEHGDLVTLPFDDYFPGEPNVRVIPAAIRKQGFLLETTISIAFRFDEEDRLIDYRIEKSLTGP